MASAYVEIPLVGKKAAGRVALVDLGDYEMVAPYGWYLQEATNPGKRNSGPYAATKVVNQHGVRTTLYMHRLVAAYLVVDHENHNGLDNRKHNLRDGSGEKNMQNRRVDVTPKSSIFKGVCWDASRQRWMAYISVSRRRRYLGRFDDEELAARAYDAVATEEFGSYALLNFPCS